MKTFELINMTKRIIIIFVIYMRIMMIVIGKKEGPAPKLGLAH